MEMCAWIGIGCNLSPRSSSRKGHLVSACVVHTESDNCSRFYKPDALPVFPQHVKAVKVIQCSNANHVSDTIMPFIPVLHRRASTTMYTIITTPQPFYDPISRTTQVSWCQKKASSGFYGARENNKRQTHRQSG